MPNVEEHCRSTLKRYGMEGRDIHQWLDEPSRKFAGGHREFRHDTETIRLVGKIFGQQYGSLAENIALDHIMLDHEEEIENRRTITGEPSRERESLSFPCSFCNTPLKTGDQTCPKCGASRKKIIEKFERAFEMDKLKLQQKKKKLRRELKLELALRELTPAQRISCWMWSQSGFDETGYDLVREELDDESPLISGDLELRPDQRKALEKLGFYDLAYGHVADAMLDRLVQEDFKEHPELKEEAYEIIEQTKVAGEEIDDQIQRAIDGKKTQRKWWQ